ncbi:MAG: glycoside hydrolase family 76 protein [Mycetocola sp.]
MKLLRPATTAAAATALILISPLTPAGAQTADASGHGDRNTVKRAAASFEAMETYLAADDGSGLYHEQYPLGGGDNPYSYEWPFSQAHIGIADLANLPGAQGRAYDDALAVAAGGQEHYWDADGGATGLPGYASYPVGEYGNGGDYFYDDNLWVGLLDAQRYLTDGDDAALDRAKEIFDLTVSGWDTDTSHANPGGVFWTQAPWSVDRNTVSTMPAAQLGLRLYDLTGEAEYLDWSLRMYEWTNTYLQRPDGLYNDHMDLEGTIESTVWSYNQGVPIGVNVLLYEATGETGYLDEAKRIADAAETFYGTDGRLEAQPAFFNSIYFKNLLLLESVTGGSSARTAMQDYADHVWDTNRDPETGLFSFDGETTQLLDQAAMVQIYAVLGWAPSQWRNLY